jgi:hypothetical protein
MKRLNDSGVIGILDRILSAEDSADSSRSRITAAPPLAESQPAMPDRSPANCQNARIPVWRGRPPRKPLPAIADKQKLTVRVNSDLADQYRNWSWECRLQLSPLIEQALKEYLRMRRNHPDGPR